ncbi:ABC transporter substrate-binding protein [Phreatobacter stygius]|uniref:ABC transporter substrate-binding protein n=1 Tax=Phreatobacter stygius TaxID=1940610 RepID=A0A4D7B0K5_9HYPH|nr:ABC transporter substrate-binding protein [Phreatobacter stygius]QCI66261.1 ABC transporter substrate-binding protein [Phreatobacter stygius]
MSSLSRRNLLAGTAGGVLASVIGGHSLAFGQGAGATPKRGGTLTATWGGFEPQSLFVPPGGGSSPYFTSTKVHERLLRLNNDLGFEPVLALEVTAAEDFMSYIIKLRPNVTWHDGKPFTADDVVFNALNYWKTISAGVALKALVGAEAVDATTVRLAFDAAVPDFFLKSILAGKSGLVIPRHLYDGRDILTNPVNNAPVGTGPFKVKEWVRGSHVEFSRNERYWDPQLPYLDRLVIRWWRDPASRSAAFEAGQLDIGVFNPTPAPDIKRLDATGRFDSTTKGYDNSAWVSTIEFNSRRDIVKRAEVRRAINHAIDRSFIAETIFFGLAKPAAGPIPSSNKLFFNKDVPVYPFDVRKAGQLLDAAGFPVRNGSRFKLNVVAAGWFEENVKLGQYVKQALEDIDITVDLAIPDRATSLKRIYTDYDYDIALSNNSGAVELVPQWTQFTTSDGILKGAAFRNANGYSNPKVDDIVARLSVEIDPKKRVALAHELQVVIATDVPWTSLVEIESVTVASADVRGHSQFADFMGESWGNVWLDR